MTLIIMNDNGQDYSYGDNDDDINGTMNQKKEKIK